MRSLWKDKPEFVMHQLNAGVWDMEGGGSKIEPTERNNNGKTHANCHDINRRANEKPR